MGARFIGETLGFLGCEEEGVKRKVDRVLEGAQGQETSGT